MYKTLLFCRPSGIFVYKFGRKLFNLQPEMEPQTLFLPPIQKIRLAPKIDHSVNLVD